MEPTSGLEPLTPTLPWYGARSAFCCISLGCLPEMSAEFSIALQWIASVSLLGFARVAEITPLLFSVCLMTYCCCGVLFDY
jgi:hypothetical protein